jgi:toxin-antitoxin system PIN domain toxin
MLIVDVNVLVHAFVTDSEQHKKHRSWLENQLLGIEPVGLSELVLSGFLRLVTNHRVFRTPAALREALAFCEAVRYAPAAISVRPGARHWDIFTDLCRAVDARANLVPDAYHAALAIENDATWVSNDRDFAKFPGLRWSQPFS